MPLTEKGGEIMGAMKKQYGEEKGKSVFYASKNKGTISGVDKRKDAEEQGQEQEQQLPVPEQLARAENELESLEREQEQAEEGLERQNAIQDYKKQIRGLRDEMKNQARQALSRIGEEPGEEGGPKPKPEGKEDRKDALEELEAKQDAEEFRKNLMDAVADAVRRLDALERRAECDDGGPGSGPRPAVGSGMIPSATKPGTYNPQAVNKAIAASNRGGRSIGGKEASAIHRVLQGRH
jgi:hypothetical protein